MDKQTKKQILLLVIALVVLLGLRWLNSEKDSSNVAISYGEGETQVVDVSDDEDVVEEAELDDKEEADGYVEENVEDDTEEVDIKSSSEKKTESKKTDSNSQDKKADDEVEIIYKFRNKGLWEEHFEKHGSEFSYKTKEDYLKGANIMLQNPDCLHKKEKEDNDDVYFLEATGEFAIVSTDGYLRTYFKPSAGKKYFDKQ